MVTGLIGKKVGMTQLFQPDGSVQPATVLKAGPCVVAQVKTVETDGYEAVQLGLVDARASKENKPMQGHFKKAGVPATRIRREVTLQAGAEAPKAGDTVNVSMFADGERVDVIGTSRGKGFQGVMKRHNFGGGAGSHGSMFHRAPGSIGAACWWRPAARMRSSLSAPGRACGPTSTTDRSGWGYSTSSRPCLRSLNSGILSIGPGR